MSQLDREEVRVIFNIPVGHIPVYTNVSLVNQLPDSAMVINLGYVDPSQVRVALESELEFESNIQEKSLIAVQPSLRFIIGIDTAKKLISQIQETLNLIENPETFEG